MIRPRRIEDIANLTDLGIGPLLVQRASKLSDGRKYAEETERDDRFLVDNVQLVGDGPDGYAGC